MSGASVAALDALFELADTVGDLMHTTLTSRELTPARAEALLVLSDSPRPLVQRELSELLRRSPRHVTGLVDTLEDGGWVRRIPHPSDRRATLVELTDAGVSAADQMHRERRQAAAELFRELPERDLTGFVTVAQHVLGQFDRRRRQATPHATPTGGSRGPR